MTTKSPTFRPFVELRAYKTPKPRCQFMDPCGESPTVTVSCRLRLEDGTIRTHGVAIDLCDEHAAEVCSTWEQ